MDLYQRGGGVGGGNKPETPLVYYLPFFVSVSMGSTLAVCPHLDFAPAEGYRGRRNEGHPYWWDTRAIKGSLLLSL